MQAAVKINYFDVTQNVYLKDENNQEPQLYKVELLKIPEFLLGIDGLESVRIFGKKNILDKFVQRIEEQELKKYGCNKIDIMIFEE